jgi:uncharacterized protein YegP (UPF0339 family)
MKAEFVIKKKVHGSFCWVLKAPNKQSILYSELYASKSACENGIESVRKNAFYEEQFERLDDRNGDPMFYLRAGNGQVIGMSNHYSSESARDNGIASVMRNAPNAVVKELV